MTEITGRSALAGDPPITPTKSQFSPKNKIPQWQSHKMRQLIIDRWQEVLKVVKARNKSNNTSSLS